MNEIQMPISHHYHIISGTNVCMIEIDEKEELKIDKLGDKILSLERGDRIFNITKDKIYCYGEVDFNSREDLETIEDFKFVTDYVQYITRYDYDKHCSYSFGKKPSWSETNSSAKLAKFAHGCLGKPERIILFKL